MQHTTINSLLQAEANALQLFEEIEKRNLIIAGKSEEQLNEDIYALAFAMFGIKEYWHKRIVRAGKNTLLPYRENPENLILLDDDILFFDFGPIFEQYEADFGRTYVLGSNAKKLQLKKDVEICWHRCKAYYDNHKNTITGAQLFAFVQSEAQALGWEFGNEHCGHLIGKYPHEKIEGEHKLNYLCKENIIPMHKLGTNRELLHWILEIHLVDTTEEIGGFFEQLLTA